MNAHEHAERASALLANLEQLQDDLDGMDADRRLQLVATGAIAKVNADLKWTAELAQAHALTGIALALSTGTLALDQR